MRCLEGSTFSNTQIIWREKVERPKYLYIEETVSNCGSFNGTH